MISHFKGIAKIMIKGEGDLATDEMRFSILTTFFEPDSPKLVRSVPVGGYLIY